MYAVVQTYDSFKKIEFFARTIDDAYAFVATHGALDKTSGYINYEVQPMVVYNMRSDDIQTWNNYVESINGFTRDEKMLREKISEGSHENVEKDCKLLIKTCARLDAAIKDLKIFLKNRIVEKSEFAYTSKYHHFVKDSEAPNLEWKPHFVMFTDEKVAQAYYGEKTDKKVFQYKTEDVYSKIRELVDKARKSEIEYVLKTASSESEELQIEIMGKLCKTGEEWAEFVKKTDAIQKFIKKHMGVLEIDEESK